MKNRRKYVVGGVVGVLAAGGIATGVASASIPSGGVITGCYKNSTGVLSLLDTSRSSSCPAGSTKIKWNQSGVRGAPGLPGARGPAGSPGAKGATGPTGPTGATGPAGPQGASGSVGPVGPAGTARDAGAVEPNGTRGVVLYPSGLRGWLAVAPLSNFSTGTYCLTPDATSTAANTTVLVSTIVTLPGVGSLPIFNGPVGTVAWDGFCPNGAVEIETFNGPYLSNQIAFEAIIP